jgi:hypothetical protein
MPPKLSHVYVENYISQNGHQLLSPYINSKTKLTIRCGVCDQLFEQVFNNINYWHGNCPSNPKKRKRMEGDCIFCAKSYPKRYTIQKYCSVKCKNKHAHVDENLKEMYTKYGREGSKISAKVQNRRSKNEIHFAELCIAFFKQETVLCNAAIFDGWDADVIIPHRKIAIRWNGAWHYKKIKGKHNLDDVQRRDRLKEEAIKKCGYDVYIIKDMGKHSPKFVKQQFDSFLNYLTRSD